MSDDCSILLPDTERTERRSIENKSTMKKYRTLFLFITTITSFFALIYYKHEYDRLHYTLKYLEIFGEPPKDATRHDQPPQCSFAYQTRATTAPAEWTKVAMDISVYSTYWDEDNGLVQPKIRTLALVEKSTSPPSNLKVKLYYETGDVLDASCEMEHPEKRSHSQGSANDYHIVFIVCVPITVDTKQKTLITVAPHSIQFGVGHGRWSALKPIQESNGFKTIEDRNAVCVIPTEDNVQSVNLVEFIAYNKILGFNKFVFYGNGLTPITRKLLDKFVDEMAITIEEKSFNFIPSLQSLNANMTSSSKSDLDYIIKRVIELDCQYRHRDMYENVVVLKLNEFIVPTYSFSITTLLKSFTILDKRMKPISEFHLSTQPVCVDIQHQDTKTDLLMAKYVHKAGPISEIGTAILRPHLMTSSLEKMPQAGVVREQHVSPATAVIYQFKNCQQEAAHDENLHLPTKDQFQSLLESSLLYRKWKVHTGA